MGRVQQLRAFASGCITLAQDLDDSAMIKALKRVAAECNLEAEILEAKSPEKSTWKWTRADDLR
jgi:hypothetical protein